jgi:hypothetical protein
MADRWPLANGNWSNAANWNGGTLPDVGDDVFADGKTVTIDQDVTVLSIRNTQRTGGTANGGFNFSTAQSTYNITADLITFNANLITLNQGLRTYNFTGNIETTQATTATVSSIAGSGNDNTINITGNINSIGQGNTRFGVSISGTTNVLNVIGNVTGGGTAGGNTVIGIYTNVSGVVINITGNLTAQGSVGYSISQPHACIATNGGPNTINITGNVLGNSTLTGGLTIAFSANTGVIRDGSTINIYGNVQGKLSTGLFVRGVQNIYVQKAIGSDISNQEGINNFTTSNVIVDTLEYTSTAAPINGKVQFATTNFSIIGQDAASNTVIFTDDNNVGTFIPAETDVRLNTTYYDGLRVGSLNVPDPSNVRNGVPTDNTVGTADLTAQDFFDAIASSSDPIAIRLRNVATVETTGDQISAFNV